MSSHTIATIDRLPNINNRSENVKGQLVPIRHNGGSQQNKNQMLVPLDTSLAKLKNKQILDRRINLHDTNLSGQVGKPQFLKQLESYLQNELTFLGAEAKEPSERRLQAFREVFENLIKDFKTYKPLLASIKNEYEMLLSCQREEIRSLEPLRQILVTVAEQCEQRILHFRNEEKLDMKKLHQKNQGLQRDLEEMNNQHTAYQVQIEQLKIELSKEYLKYRDECDARKLLISDINDMRYQQDDMMLNNKDELDDSDSGDPVILKIALKKAREDERAASQRLLIIEATYNDVIPRKDYETLNTTFKDLTTKQNKLVSDLTSLTSDHEILQNLYKQAVLERDEFYAASENLRRNATPRPQWNRCADVVAGGNQRWIQLSEGKTSSDQLVQVLLNEIAGNGGSDTLGSEYFDPMGIEERVPLYLRYEEKVRNRRLGKRDCLLTIKDVWNERYSSLVEAKKQEVIPERVEFQKFLHEYFQKRFGIGTAMCAEWAYNLHDSCDRYQHDEAVRVFAESLSKEYDEDLYHSQRLQSEELLEFLTRLDVDNGAVGTLNKLEFQEALGQIYPDSSQENTMALLGAAELELQAKESEDLIYQNLFQENSEGKVGIFLKELRKQSTEERYQYIDDIKKVLIGEGIKTKIKVDDLKKAITQTDRMIDHKDMERYISWAYKVDKDQNKLKNGATTESDPEKDIDKVAEINPIEMNDLVNRLKNGNIKRIGEKNK